MTLVSTENQKEIERIIASEKLNYAPLTDTQDRIDKVWIFSEFIRQKKMIEFDYTSPYRKGTKKHTALFDALYYDNHYFYLKGFDIEKQMYLDFRLDRVISWRNSDVKKPRIAYRDVYKDGEHRNLKVDAFSGERIRFTVFYTQDPNILLDKFPRAEITKTYKNGCEIEIESQNTLGLKLYIISQLDGLKVLSPPSLIEEIKDILEKMQKNYFS